MRRRLLSTLIYLATLPLFAWAQANVTIYDTNSQIKFNPICNPRDRYCQGGWYSWNFWPTSARTITFGPGNSTIIPSASFTFQGSAVYFYSIAAPNTAVVQITLDGGSPQTVNLTAKYGLTSDSEVQYPVLSWSQNGLDPSSNHTFFLEWADPDSDQHKWAGFDSIVYTAPSTVMATTTWSARPGATGTGAPPAESAIAAAHRAIGGLIAGLVVAAVVIIALIIFGFFWWRRWRRRAGTVGMTDLDADDMAPAPITGGNSRATLAAVTPYTLVPNTPAADTGATGVGRRNTSSDYTRASSPIEHSVSSEAPLLGEKRRQSLLSDRSSEPYNTETMQEILNQQRAIMQMLQDRGGASSSSAPPIDSATGWPRDIKQLYQPTVSNPASEGLPPGAAAPTPALGDTGALQPPAYFR